MVCSQIWLNLVADNCQFRDITKLKTKTPGPDYLPWSNQWQGKNDIKKKSRNKTQKPVLGMKNQFCLSDKLWPKLFRTFLQTDNIRTVHLYWPAPPTNSLVQFLKSNLCNIQPICDCSLVPMLQNMNQIIQTL